MLVDSIIEEYCTVMHTSKTISLDNVKKLLCSDCSKMKEVGFLYVIFILCKIIFYE